MENNEEIDIKRIIEIIFSKKLIITLIILLSVTLGYVYSYYYKKPEYKSSVTILLVADENKTDKSLTQTDVNLNNGLISTYSSIAKSSSILQKTIQNLNLDIPVSKLEQNVEAKQIDNTQFLEISVKNESPERAKNIANELAEVFTEQIKEIYNLQNISIVDKAETEENPCNINHMKDMIIFGFAGIVLSIIIVMIIYMFDDTVKDQKDIEKNIKLRIIGTLPVDREKTELIVENNPKSPIVESIKTIRTNILYSTRKNSILVTSCKEKEGKSWVINNLAVTFAQTGKRVILVDANLRQENNKNEIFNIEKCEGLSDFIREISEDQMENLEKARKYIKETSIPNLHIMQNGTIPPNPAELISSKNMKRLVNLLKNMYDIVIIDGTSSILVADSIALSSMVDSTILVAENRKTKINDLKKVKKLIEDVNGNILGVILNRVDVQSGKYYGKKYGYYYGHDVEEIGKKLEEKQESISLDEVIELAREKIELQSPIELEDDKEISKQENNNQKDNEIKLLKQELLDEISKIKNSLISFKRKEKNDKRINNMSNSINNINNNINSFKQMQESKNKEILEIQENNKRLLNLQENRNKEVLQKIQKIEDIQNENKKELILQIQELNEEQEKIKDENKENVDILVQQFIEEINTLKNEIKELKENQDLNKNELLDKIENIKDEKLNEQIQTVKNSNNIISFEALRRKKPNKKVFNINDDTISFEDLQRLSNYVVDLKDESTLIAMNN
ncbi:capsular exopolysaccharide family [Clostridium sp. CAG:389]|nr:capsular exopolysaccharide family [Clostridium sp. CAG:389]